MPNGYDSIHLGAWHDNQLSITEIFDRIYPIGSIYISVNDTNPSVLFGGTWEQITGRFLLATGYPGNNTYDGFGTIKQPDTWHVYPEQTGGEDYHTLTTDEMPSHRHDINKYVGMVNNTAAFVVNDSNFDGLVASDCMSRTVNSVPLTDAQREQINANTGGSQWHNNLPPYFGVNMWQRIE